MKKTIRTALATLLVLALTLSPSAANAYSLLGLILAEFANTLIYGAISVPAIPEEERETISWDFPTLDKPRDSFRGNLNLTLGAKFLNHAQWKPFGTQIVTGIHYDSPFEGEEKLALVADLLAGFESLEDEPELYDESGRLLMRDSFTSELGIGVRRYFGNPMKSALFVGGGAAYLHGEVDRPGRPTEGGDDIGWWVSAGNHYMAKNRLNLGGEARYSTGSIHLGKKEVDPGGFSLLFNLGYSW